MKTLLLVWMALFLVSVALLLTVGCYSARSAPSPYGYGHVPDLDDQIQSE